MGLFDYLFDSEYKQRRDLLSLQDTNTVTTSTVDRVSSDLIALRLRVDRAELAAEALPGGKGAVIENWLAAKSESLLPEFRNFLNHFQQQQAPW